MFETYLDAERITNYNRSREEMELLLLFTPAVAGKTARMVAGWLQNLLAPYSFLDSPFEAVRCMIHNGVLRSELERARMGKYSVLEKAYSQLLALADSGRDLTKPTVEDLESIHGFGPKSARMVVLHSVPNAKVAVLDVHILRWLRKEFGDSIRRDYGFDVPQQTPNGKRYRILEKVFVDYADARGLSVADLDLSIWKEAVLARENSSIGLVV